jgi:hypothetical protein
VVVSEVERPFPNGHKCSFGCNGDVTAIAAGQSQRFYSCVEIFNLYYPSSLPQISLAPGVGLEWRGLNFYLMSVSALSPTVSYCVLCIVVVE